MQHPRCRAGCAAFESTQSRRPFGVSDAAVRSVKPAVRGGREIRATADWESADPALSSERPFQRSGDMSRPRLLAPTDYHVSGLLRTELAGWDT